MRQDSTWPDTGHWSISNSETKAEIHTEAEEEGCVVWYFWNWISDFTRLRLAGFCYTETEFAYFQNHWVGSLCSGSGWPGRNMWSAQPAPSPHPALAVKTKTPVSVFRTASVKIPANILSLPHPAIIIQLQQSVCLVMLDLASKGVKLPHTSASVWYRWQPVLSWLVLSGRWPALAWPLWQGHSRLCCCTSPALGYHALKTLVPTGNPRLL